MEQMRNFMQSWVGKAVLVITLIPMAFLGVQSFSGGGQIAPNQIVKVGDTAIDTATFQSEVNNYRARLLEQVDGSLINNKALNDEVLDSMIDRALLENQAQFFGMTVSDDAITRLLQADPTFHDANGRFSNDIFAHYLQSRGMNKDMLFAMFRTQLSLRQLTNSILGTAVYPDSQISRLIDLQTQSREAWVVRYNWQDFANQVTVSPAEIETYYNANKQDMIQSPSVDLAYVTLSDADIKVDAVSEDEIRVEYQASLQGQGDGRQLSHILLTGDDAESRAKDIKAKLDAGESFEALAKAHSDDPTGESGGDIGSYNPAFFGDSSSAVENAISGLTAGGVSEPVQTGFGYHIFKVTKMGDAPSLDSMRDELTKRATERKRANAMNEMITKINTMATDSMGISDIAQETGLTARSIKGYTEDNNTSELSAPVVVSAAFDDFAISDQSVSPNITLADKTVWVQPTNYQDARELTLAEASEQIKATLTKQKAIKLALDTANARAKEDPATLTKSAQRLGVVTRQSPELLPAERASLFVHNKDGMSAWVVETDAGASVMVGDKAQSTATAQISDAERLSASQIIRDNVGQDQLQDYLHYLRDTKEVQINEQAMSH
ncbi:MULTISPECIES: SurA N-terminal domain-containing protein [Moraxella]|uniref:Periplasmic chaperone PpiD n=2 Tax=Moraxellaceae TaxID=468 RepID=A0A1B8PXX6_MORLA|nr:MULTISPECIES: SurA N-terminal domain-containing protein [Moraxella]MBE9596020.1 SurA N-terminal domain-containing protein [Moraxella sp. K2450]MBE9578502.1 SurA N-terminal domain-containing protein [Moraxella sp. K1664]MBE9587844.1 SurA N-terminal domain-containing protein [Moraxella sp. K1630]MDH9218315.1 SurA N-terminal domain-containing protein [Moraxella lacunata]MDI4482502.1 peptidylprolyl isomerase [Moraxella lacunata]